MQIGIKLGVALVIVGTGPVRGLIGRVVTQWQCDDGAQDFLGFEEAILAIESFSSMLRSRAYCLFS